MTGPGFAGAPLYALKLGGVLTPLAEGETILGRGGSADIVVPSEQASRNHARITVRDRAASIEDLGSTNGVYVNDEKIARPTPLAVRDRIRIGDVAMRLVYFDDLQRTRRGNAPTVTELAAPGLDVAPPPDEATTRPKRILDVVGPLFTKSLALGRHEEAERLLRGPLDRLLAEAREGKPIPPETVEGLSTFAVKLAAATAKPTYIDLVIQVHAALDCPLPLPVVDELYAVLRNVRGVDRSLLRSYVARLSERASSLGPTARFAIKRIAGLPQLAAG